MNAVDRFNKSIKSLNLHRPSKKWDRKLSVFIFEAIIHNAYILYKKPEKKYNKTCFLEDLSKHFLDYNSEEDNHFCENDEKPRRCVVCYKKGERKTTIHKCFDCKKHLHPGICYKEYHIDKFKATKIKSSQKSCENLETSGNLEDDITLENGGSVLASSYTSI